ncbi:MAG: 3-deoxy-manno-octulosonate cytidylyltransferase [Gemmatimonadaceae bacterium]
MRTLAVIPARVGATRLPRKPLRLLGGVPLVVRVWERLTALGVADTVVVATDSHDVVDAVSRVGALCVMTRDDHPSGTDRVAEVAARAEHTGYDVIINVQGDEPFVSGDAVRGAAEMVSSGRFPLGTAAVPIDAFASAWTLASPNIVKVVHADDGRAMYFSRAPIPFLREPADAAQYAGIARQHIGVYAYTRDALARWVALPTHPLERVERLEQLRPLAAGMPMGVAVIGEQPGIGIDTEDDLERANARWPDFIAGRT